jgi:hypothetical protein
MKRGGDLNEEELRGVFHSENDIPHPALERMD